MADQPVPIKQDLTSNEAQCSNDTITKQQSDTSTAGIVLHSNSLSHTTIVYWDHDSMPIPNGHTVEDITQTVKQHICDKLGSQPIHFRLYTSLNVFSSKQQESLFDNGIEHIHIPVNTNHTSESKCILRSSTDIALKLFELKQNKESKCNIALMANEDDYAYLLSRIHKQSPIASLLYITLDQINLCLINHVDLVIQCELNTHHRKRQRDYTNDIPRAPTPKRQRVTKKNNTIRITFRPLGSHSTSTVQHDMAMEINTNTKIKTLRKILRSMIRKQNVIAKRKKSSKKKTIPKPSLKFNGYRLKEKKALQCYNIHDGDVIHWLMSFQVRLRQKQSSGVVISICIKTDWDVSAIITRFKEKLDANTISMYPGLAKQDIHLFYNTGTELKLLNDNQTLLAQLDSFASNDFLEWDYKCTNSSNEYQLQNDIIDLTDADTHLAYEDKNKIKMVQHTEIMTVAMPRLESGSDLDLSGD
eukprot:191256_1